MMKKEDLLKYFEEKEIPLTGEESYQDMMKMYRESKETDMGDEEMEKQRAELEAELAAKKMEKATGVTTQATDGVQMVPLAQVEEMMKNLTAKLEAKFAKKDEEEMEPERFKYHTIRVPRIEVEMEGVKERKFVIGFKNMNLNDEYDDSSKEVMERLVPDANGVNTKSPWVTLIFDDGTEQMYPLLPFMDRAVGVPFEIINTTYEDRSYSIGKTEQGELSDDGYSYKGTGIFVDMKVDLKKPTYHVRHPETLKELVVHDTVVNLVPDKSKTK